MHLNWKYLKMRSSSHCPSDTWQLLGQSGDWVNNQCYNRIFVKFLKLILYTGSMHVMALLWRSKGRL